MSVVESPRPTVTPIDAAAIRSALLRRYSGSDLSKMQYVCLEEARSGAGFDGNAGACDFLAINTFKGRGMELVGHEIKVSVQDWRKEHATPEKAERFARFCRRWYLVVPSALAGKIRDEVPEAWGLWSVSDAGRITEIQKATPRKPDDVPVWWWIGWLAQIDRQSRKRIPLLLNAAMADERERTRAQIDKAVEARLREVEGRRAKQAENLAKIEKIVGLRLEHVWGHDLERLRVLWRLTKNCPDVGGLVHLLRRTADALEVEA